MVFGGERGKMNAYEKLANRFKKRILRLTDKYDNKILLGLIKVFDEEYDNLKTYSRTLLQKYSINTIKIYPECCFIIVFTLVQIAIRETSEDGQREFWVIVCNALNVDYKDVLKCKYILLKHMQFNDYFFYMNDKRHEYVRTVDCHAVLPSNSANKVYDFLYDAYLRDLEEEYDASLIDDYIDIMFDYFNAYINFDDDESDDILSSGIKISKHYMLTKPFRIACLNHRKIMKDFIKKTIFQIDQVSFKDVFPEDTELFSKEFISWWKNKQKEKFANYEVDSSETRVYKKEQTRRERRFISAYYQLKGTELILNIPQQRLTLEQIENEIILNLYNGDELLPEFTKKIKVFGHVMFRTEEEIIKLNRIYNKLRYEIISGNEIVYDSKEILFRSSLLFSSDGFDEINGKDLCVGEIKVIASLETEIVPDCNFDKMIQDNFIIYILFLHENSSFLLDNRFYSIEQQMYESRINYEYKHKGAYIYSNGRSYSIFTDLPSFGIRCEGNANAKKYVVNINETQLRLSSFCKTKSFIVEDGSGDEYISCSMTERQVQDYKFYSLTIRKAGDSKFIIKEDFIVIPDFNCEFEKELYYDEKTVKILSIAGNSICFDNIQFPYTVICGAENIARIKCKIDNVLCEMVVELPVVSWKLDNYISENSEPFIWRNNIDEYIFILKYHFSTPKLLINKIQTINGDRRYAAIYYDLRSFFECEEDFEIGVEIDGKYIEFTRIIFTPKVIEAYFAYNKSLQAVLGSWKLIGEGSLEIKIVSRENSKVVFGKKYIGVNSFEEHMFLSYGFYSVIVTQEQEDEFSASGNDELLLNESTFLVGDKFYLLLKGREVKVDNCYYFDNRFDVENFFFDNIKIEQENLLYTASAFFYKRKMQTGELFKWYMNESNPVRIEIIDIDSDQFIIEIREQSDDGFIYDKNTKHIMPDSGQKNRRRYQTADYYIVNLEGLL